MWIPHVGIAPCSKSPEMDGNLLTYQVSRSNQRVGSRKDELVDWKFNKKNLEDMDKKMCLAWVFSLWYSPLSAYINHISRIRRGGAVSGYTKHFFGVFTS